MHHFLTRLLTVLFVLSALPLARAETPSSCDYAVVVSKRTHDDKLWKPVVEALVKKYADKYRAQVIEYADDVNESLEPLQKIFPRYAAFVAQPEEAGRDFVVKVHRLTRKLDDDPYTDVLWGIVTGYRADDALRIVNMREPLLIHRAAAGTGIDLTPFEQGVWFNEGTDDEYTEKSQGGKPEIKHGHADAAKPLVDFFDALKPQLFVTSGHATWRDWQIGYPPHNRGQFRCADGVLYGVDRAGKRYPLRSPNPKVYLPVGNCLMGRIVDKQSMALAWLGSGGVDQMIGYVVSTWYGRGGWGTRDYFFSEAGRYSLSEAFYFNNQSLVYDLQTRFAKTANIDFTQWDMESDPSLMSRLVKQLGYTRDAPELKDDLGLHWDRDTVAFYGDPAWDARIAPQPAPFTQKLDVRGDRYTFTMTATEDCTPGRPPAMLLPHRIEQIKIVGGESLKPLVTGKFIMVMQPGKFAKGKSYEVAFTAKKAVRGAAIAKIDTSATAEKNSRPWAEALKTVPAEQRDAVAFLLANMPPDDLKSLSKDFLLANVRLAYRARAEVPWGADLPDEIFFNDVLPYASINERRDDWRKDFFDRFLPLAKKCKTPGEAAILLNKEVFRQFDVKYHATKRPKPDQSPYESAQSHYASCTGLSVLIVDACRAAAIPARFAGTPLWTDNSGNHSWAEVWDGQWRIIGSAESTKLDDTWFNAKAAKADAATPINCIYATSFARTDKTFPMVWADANHDVPAVDVTPFYTHRRAAKFAIVDEHDKVVAASLTIRLNSRIVAHGRAQSQYEFILAGGQEYEAEYQATGKPSTWHFVLPAKGGETVALKLK